MNSDSVTRLKGNNLRPEWEIILDVLVSVDAVLWGRILRRMIYYLFTHNVREIVDLMKELEPYAQETDQSGQDLYDNVPNPKIDTEALKSYSNRIFQIAGQNLPDEEITTQLRKWLAQEKTIFLSMTLERGNVPLMEIREVLERFFKIPQQEIHMSPDDRTNVSVALIRRFLSGNLDYIRIAKQFIDLSDFFNLQKRIVGSAGGQGKLGGKSAGMMLAFKIIEKEKERRPELQGVKIPSSWFITSNTTTDFIHFNALEEIVSLKYMSTDEIRTGFPYLQHLFKNSFFPGEIVAQLEMVLGRIGEKPIIVRSSSLLEDSFEAAFSGKYKSFFLPNQGSRSERLAALLDAIAEVYASVFSPDPIEYRKERKLLDFQEEMGVLIQEVVGNRVGKYFFPTCAGVAFSNNDFPWSTRVNPQDGMARMVAGLGTRAVDRVADDYPFLASPAKPNIRVNASIENTIRYSQKRVDVINLESGRFETLAVQDLLLEVGHLIPGIEQVVSVDADGMLASPKAAVWDPRRSPGFVTFQGMQGNARFFSQLHAILQILQDKLSSPVDIEFAWDGSNIFLLQCRAQHVRLEESVMQVPENVDAAKILFSTRKYVTNALLPDISHVVYVDGDGYAGLSTPQELKSVAAAIFRLNRLLPPKKFILMGPGRWGSRGDIKLGVPVTYSDINNTAMLIEVACKKGDYTPEVSFGTHFFQDLVESQIKYLPVFPDEAGSFLNFGWLARAHNSLARLLPDLESLQPVIKVIAIHEVEKDAVLRVIMNQAAGRALAFVASGPADA